MIVVHDSQPKKENLIVVVGAGASIKAGLPSTADLLETTQDALPTIVEDGTSYLIGDQRFAIQRRTRLADILDGALTGAYKSYDFEMLLHAIEELGMLALALETPALLEEFRPVISAFAELGPRYARIADSQFLRNARLGAIAALHRLVGERSIRPMVHMPFVPDPTASRQQVQRILAELAERFRLIVVNLNYDDVVDGTAIRWGDGFGQAVAWSKDPYLPAKMVGENRCEAFSPSLWDAQVADRECNLLIHLHGSIRFGWPTIAAMQTIGRYAEPVKFATHEEAHESLANFGFSGNIVGGQSFDATPIISGRQKGGKMIYNARPYGYYYRAVMDLVPTASNMLVLGYGWRDVHLNTWIEEMNQRSPDNRKIAVVTHIPGTEVGENTPQNRYMALLGRQAWTRLQSRAFARAAGSPNSDFHQDGNFVVLPSGFDLDAGDEAQLNGFF